MKATVINLADARTWPVRMVMSEIAAVLRISKRSLYDRIASGRFPKSDDGRTWARDVVERYVTGGIKQFERDAERRRRRAPLQLVGER